MGINYAPISGEASLDRAEYRKAISLFPTGIAIVASEDEDGAVHGMTVNSFTSISLEPPTVMISLKAGKMHQMISRQGWYGVSILRGDQQSYSAHYGGHPHAQLEPNFVIYDRVPIVKDSLAWFECEITERIQVQDHTLFIAQVAICGHYKGSPLIFYASRYHRQALEAC